MKITLQIEIDENFILKLLENKDAQENDEIIEHAIKQIRTGLALQVRNDIFALIMKKCSELGISLKPPGDE